MLDAGWWMLDGGDWWTCGGVEMAGRVDRGRVRVGGRGRGRGRGWGRVGGGERAWGVAKAALSAAVRGRWGVVWGSVRGAAEGAALLAESAWRRVETFGGGWRTSLPSVLGMNMN